MENQVFFFDQLNDFAKAVALSCGYGQSRSLDPTDIFWNQIEIDDHLGAYEWFEERGATIVIDSQGNPQLEGADGNAEIESNFHLVQDYFRGIYANALDWGACMDPNSVYTAQGEWTGTAEEHGLEPRDSRYVESFSDVINGLKSAQ